MASILVFVAVACGPEVEDPRARAYGDNLCAAIDDCGCAARLDSVDACSDWITARVQNDIDEGAEIQSDCFETVNDSIRDCTIASRVEDHCIGLQGNRSEGESCSNDKLGPLHIEPCATGLGCIAGTCYDLSAGEVSIPGIAIGEPCPRGFIEGCELGARCGSDGICHELAELGETCEDFGCAGGNEIYCAGAEAVGTGVCSVEVVVGEPCNPLDWGVCTGEYDPDSNIVPWCDPATTSCAIGPGRLCSALNIPYLWRED